MKIIINHDGTIRLPYQHDGAELLDWLKQKYPHSRYRVVELEKV